MFAYFILNRVVINCVLIKYQIFGQNFSRISGQEFDKKPFKVTFNISFSKLLKYISLGNYFFINKLNIYVDFTRVKEKTLQLK